MIEIPNTDPIYDPAWAEAAVVNVFTEALSAYKDLINDSVALLKRTLTTGPDDIPHHIILAVLFRQAVVASDAARELAMRGATDAANVQLRALMEARWGLKLALTNPKKWGLHIYVASRREELSQTNKSIPGTREYDLDRDTRELIAKYGGKPLAIEDAEKFRTHLEALLNRSDYAVVNQGFADFARKNSYEAPWYYDAEVPKKERVTSIFKLARKIGAAGEYASVYRHASYYMHGGYIGTHLTMDEKGVAVTPVRSPADARQLLLLGFSLLSDCCIHVIDYWRPDERTAFTRAYVEKWRDVIRRMPKVELELGRAINRS